DGRSAPGTRNTCSSARSAKRCSSLRSTRTRRWRFMTKIAGAMSDTRYRSHVGADRLLSSRGWRQMTQPPYLRLVSVLVFRVLDPSVEHVLQGETEGLGD